MTDTALILIDIQNDYFPDGLFPLVGMEAAAKNAVRLLTQFRAEGLPVLHVQHVNGSPDARFFKPGTDGVAHHASVLPAAGEPVIVKAKVNSFLETDLQAELEARGIRHLVMAGAMSSMCIDSATRAARDRGFDCTVVHDACAAPNLEFGGDTIPAPHVHGAFMAALRSFASVVGTDEALAA